MTLNLDQAKSFIKSIDLSGITRRPVTTMDASSDAGTVFDQAKDQARVVGSGLYSFAQGVDEQVREAISDSALLAQLVADKGAAQNADPMTWFANYSGVLKKVGWTLQDHQFTDYTTQGTAAEVNQKIIDVMTAALAPGAAALAIIAATLNALRAMNPDSPWITLFDQEAQHASIARFQIGLVDIDANKDVFVLLMACLLEADSTITQVLFFKFRQANATFKASSDKVSINRASLVALGPAIRAKTLAYQQSYVSSILDISTP